MKIKDIDRKKLPCIIISAIFVIFLAVFSIGTRVEKDRKFSEMENRNLAQKPKASVDKIMKGEYQEQYESYLSDQIVGKDVMMGAKTCTEYFTGKTYQNGVYFSKDGYLLQRYVENADNITKNLKYVNDFAAKTDVPIDFMLVPNSICINSDKLPFGAVTDDQINTINYAADVLDKKISFFCPHDTLQELEKSGIQTFYKTDHHWTASAARACTDKWLSSIGITPVENGYQYHEVKDFYGTLYSKAPAPFIRPDKFGYYTRQGGRYTVKYVMENKFSYNLMEDKFFKKKDKYASFFGGNFAQIKIGSNSENRKKLLVIKDSYANSALPIIADNFSDVYVVDMRYFHFGSVSELIKSEGIDRVLLLYNVDFLNEDKNFVWLS